MRQTLSKKRSKSGFVNYTSLVSTNLFNYNINKRRKTCEDFLYFQQNKISISEKKFMDNRLQEIIHYNYNIFLKAQYPSRGHSKNVNLN